MHLQEHSTSTQYVWLLFPHTLLYPVFFLNINLLLHIICKPFLPQIFAMNLIKPLDLISFIEYIR